MARTKVPNAIAIHVGSRMRIRRLALAMSQEKLARRPWPYVPTQPGGHAPRMFLASSIRTRLCLVRTPKNQQPRLRASEETKVRACKSEVSLLQLHFPFA